MKNMKKLVMAMLALTLCLGLAACAPADDKAFDAAVELLEAGEYDEAIDAFRAIGRYEEITEKIEEAEKLRDEENAGFLFGTWKDIATGTEFEFKSRGRGTCTTVYADGNNIPFDFTYSCSGDEVRFDAPLLLTFEVTKEAGVTHLVEAYGQYDLVPEDEYVEVAPVAVEITMDNWQEYFELRETEQTNVNGFGEVDYRQIGYGVFLKDEYIAQLPRDYVDLEISFELQYDEALFKVNGDFLSGEYTLEEASLRWFSTNQGLTAITNVWDNRTILDAPAGSTQQNTVSGFFHSAGGGWMEENGVTYIIVPINPEILRVQGSLTLMS